MNKVQDQLFKLIEVQNFEAMKRTQLFLPAAGLFIFFVFALSACRKHTCQCTTYSTANPEPTGYTTFTVKGSAAKKKKYCTNRSTKPDANGSYMQCVIK
ncbi:MAG: hypothetical protein Q8L81_05855 [Bacteroidota bacterium]|nr:hypothetical protein [Bacteroidota bacterium]